MSEEHKKTDSDDALEQNLAESGTVANPAFSLNPKSEVTHGFPVH